MRETDLHRAIQAVFGQVFEARPEEITNQTRRGDLERWDSLGHLVLLEALREEFRIEIEPEQALEMETVGDVKRVLTTLLSEKDSR
ncbi:MAG TPA: acyl carrier protein [Terriglobales bacterium]|nr:acyl carrier protein [Terriglobales bacterium]